MQDHFSELKKNCEILFSTLNLDVILSDRNQNILLHLLHNPFPEELRMRWGAYHTQMLQQLEDTESDCTWHSMYDDLMLFLDIQLPLGNEVYYVTLGPALTKVVSDVTLVEMVRQNLFPPKAIHIINNYIRKTPFFTPKTRSAFWISTQLLLREDLPPSVNPHPNIQNSHSDTKLYPITSEQIQINYNAEKKWLAFVAAGDALSARRAFHQMTSNDHQIQQSSDPARMLKNLLHTINGMCKTAAYSGGASPSDVFSLSQKVTEAIEAIENTFIIEKIVFEMLDGYCETVVSARTAGYSPPVRKAIEFISSHYTQSLSRKEIAREIHYSEGHLSRVFQQETGQKISDYLYGLRIQNACRLLKTGSYSVTDVALLTGFSSYGKFSVEFKKQMGLTASEYQKR